MIRIDYIALENANKGLTVIFILLITLINFSLIASVLKKGNWLYRPSSLTVISLALGDILLALFPLVVSAIQLFDTPWGISCMTSITSGVYGNYLINFVYGTGLVVLAVELVYRYKPNRSTEKTGKNIVVSLLVSSLPWILGLVIVLPLSLAGSDCYSSYNPQRIRATYGVAVLMPAAAAIVACGIVKYSTTLFHVQFNSLSVAYPVGGSHVLVAAPSSIPTTTQPGLNPYLTSTAPPPTNASEGLPLQASAQQETQYGSVDGVYQKTPELQTNTHSASSLQPQPNPPTAYSPGFPPQPPPYQQSAYHQGSPPQANLYQPPLYHPAIVPSYALQPVDSLSSFLPDPNREKTLLLAVAVTHFVCNVPFACFMMALAGYNLSDLGYVVMDALGWWSFFRSIVTPVILRQLYRRQ